MKKLLISLPLIFSLTFVCDQPYEENAKEYIFTLNVDYSFLDQAKAKGVGGL